VIRTTKNGKDVRLTRYISCDVMNAKNNVHQSTGHYRPPLTSSSHNIYRPQWPRGLRCGLCRRSRTGIAGSNPAGDMNVCLLWLLADHSSRGVLPSVMRLSVIAETFNNEEALAH